MSVYFHGSFGLNRKFMAGILKGLILNPDANNNELAKPYGYKAPFTQRYRSWLNKTGIIEGKRSIRLTPAGEIIWKKDPKLESIITKWFLHHELTSDPEKAEAWYYFIKEFLPKNKSFSKMD